MPRPAGRSPRRQVYSTVELMVSQEGMEASVLDRAGKGGESTRKGGLLGRGDVGAGEVAPEGHGAINCPQTSSSHHSSLEQGGVSRALC